MLYSLSDWISYVWSGSHHFSLSGNPHFTRLVCFDSNGCWSWLWIRTTHIAFLMTSSWTLLLHGLHILKVCIFCHLLGKINLLTLETNGSNWVICKCHPWNPLPREFGELTAYLILLVGLLRWDKMGVTVGILSLMTALVLLWKLTRSPKHSRQFIVGR